MDNLSAVFPGTGSNINNPVRRVNGFFVMLDHDQGVTQITKFDQGVNKATVVTLVQANARFI